MIQEVTQEMIQEMPSPFFPEGDSRISLRDVICRELGSGTRNLFKYFKRYLGADPVLGEGDVFRARPQAGKRRNGAEALAKGRIGEERPRAHHGTRPRGARHRRSCCRGRRRYQATASSHLNRLAAEGAIIAHGETKNRRYEFSPR
jgi:hypothetical protein